MIDDDVRRAHEQNRIAWNDAAAAYTATDRQRADFLRGGGISLHPIETAALGELGTWCARAVHLQCASGRDTLSLLNAGVGQVVGVDISDVHIANAERTTADLGWGDRVRWFRCDVLDTPAELDGTADLVYTGRGALVWLHDLDAWARVVARLLRPGGVFHVFDDHPAAFLFDQDSPGLAPSGVDYFHHAEIHRGWTPQYIGDLGRPAEEHPEKYERVWTIAQVFGALTGAGVVVDRLGEHPDEYWQAFPKLPEQVRRRLPMTFSLRAHRPPRDPRSPGAVAGTGGTAPVVAGDGPASGVGRVHRG
ncbi:MAG TPA: class I SAM-dependent methyltransferase [Kineosporiaceae bacterium]|nr:class I SAM-dependent methyltransferase [Kineosporiaceae bacterium]